MTITLSKSTSQSSQSVIAEGLRCVGGDDAVRRALAADHIRSALYASALLSAEWNYPSALHTTRLLTTVRKCLDLVWPGTATEHLRETTGKAGDTAQQTLDSLAELGDVMDSGGGFWIGTPLRLIRCDGAVVILGAAPNAVLKHWLGNSPICAGISRFGNVPTPFSAEKDAVTLPVEQWLGAVEGLEAWTKQLLQQHELRMQSGNEIPAAQLEIYAPDIFASQRRQGRWLPAQSVNQQMEGVRLCRPLLSYSREWARPFYLAHLRFVSGELVVSRSASVDYGVTRRLRFGFDALLKTAQNIAGTAKGDLVEFEIPPGLPHPESRIAALGWPSLSNSRRTVFHRLAVPIFAEVMRRLSVAVSVR